MALPYKKIPRSILAYQAPTGQLPLSQLSRVTNGSFIIGDFQLQAARAMRAMAAEARKANIVIASSGDYRTYTEQVTLFRSRYVDTRSVTNPPGGADDRFWPRAIYGGTNTYWRRVRGAAAAVPGKSNHGLGLANDMAQRTPSGGIVALTVKVGNMSLWDWLNANGRRFGWSWGEAISENWHWVYIEGDDIPVAVLAFEKGTNGGRFMEPVWVHDVPTKTIWLCDGIWRHNKTLQHYALASDLARLGGKTPPQMVTWNSGDMAFWGKSTG